MNSQGGENVNLPMYKREVNVKSEIEVYTVHQSPQHVIRNMFVF